MGSEASDGSWGDNREGGEDEEGDKTRREGAVVAKRKKRETNGDGEKAAEDNK